MPTPALTYLPGGDGDGVSIDVNSVGSEYSSSEKRVSASWGNRTKST
jgi:hypothetical protein